MKSGLFLIFYLVAIYCPLSISAQAVIIGTVIGFGKEFKVTTNFPIGQYYESEVPTIQNVTTPDGSFSIKASITKPAFIFIRVGMEPIRLFIEPKDTIGILLKITKDKNRFLKVSGQNAQGNYWYNINNYPPAANFIQHDSLLSAISKMSPVEGMKGITIFLKQEERPLDSLLHEKKN